MLPFFLIGTLFAAPVGDGQCLAPPEYYQIALLPTRRVPEARLAEGAAHLTFVESPFGLSMTRSGQYKYSLDIRVSGLRPVEGHQYIGWIAKPDLKDYRRLGPLETKGGMTSEVDWNKFIVFITLESSDADKQASWQGPVVLRGMSRSGLMHTMAGHGPYEQEPCTVYGYY